MIHFMFFPLQNVAPFFVATALSGMRRTNLFVADANQYARSALATVGIMSFTHGTLSHSMQVQGEYRHGVCFCVDNLMQQFSIHNVGYRVRMYLAISCFTVYVHVIISKQTCMSPHPHPHTHTHTQAVLIRLIPQCLLIPGMWRAMKGAKAKYLKKQAKRKWIAINCRL